MQQDKAAARQNVELTSLWTAINRAQAVIEFDTTGRILDANENFLKLMGYALEEVRGAHHRMFCDASYTASPDYQEFWVRLAKGELESGLFKRRTRDGRDVWIQASYNPIFDSNGAVTKIVKFATDVTASRMQNAEYEAKVTAIDRVQGVIEFDPTGHVLNANQNFLSLVGYTLEQIKGQHHRMFCDDATARSLPYREFWDKLRHGEYDAGEYQRYGKNGKEIWIQASYNPVFDLDGKIIKIVKFATDITQTKLRNAEYEAKVAAISRVQGVIEFDTTGRILNANENFLAVVGYELDEIRGQHHRMFCDEGHAQSPQYRDFWEVLRRGEFSSGEYKRVGKGGREIWLQASYNPVFDASGRVVRIVKFATDITKTKLASLEAKAKVDAIGRAAGVVEFDLEGNVLWANDNFLDLMGYTAREIVGKHHRAFCEDDYVKSVEYRSFWSRLSRGDYYTGRYQRVGKHGHRVWIQASYNPIFDLSGKPFKVVKYATDITEQVEREQEIRAKAAEMTQSINDLSASITQIASSAKQTSTLATETQTHARAGNNAVQRSIEAMRGIEEASNSVSEAAKVISEIASQTNLLAFNAAIEAARAGQHGQGFSVVADEVRKLAEKSAAAAGQISMLIVDTVHRIKSGSEISREAEQAFEVIARGVEKTTESISQIHGTTEHQSAATKRVADLVQGLASRK